MYKHSSLTHLLRITAWCKRFIFNYVSKTSIRLKGALNATEIHQAEKFWIRNVQQASFVNELCDLRNNRQVSSGSRLRLLNPFLDSDGIIRVGGRLSKSALEYGEKHPIVLCKSNHLSKLIIKHAHLTTLHGGVKSTIRYVRQKYWILSVRNKVKMHLRTCIPCFKQNARTATQMMGDLPRPRIVQGRAFLHVGVDYAGPINVRNHKGRGHKSHKTWIALFICFATKAVHIELVHDYTTDSFIAAFKRFTSRRGICSDIYSDCGTNFVGASIKLKNDRIKAMKNHHEVVANFFSSNSITWHLNPPSAPHFGGLWE